MRFLKHRRVVVGIAGGDHMEVELFEAAHRLLLLIRQAQPIIDDGAVAGLVAIPRPAASSVRWAGTPIHATAHSADSASACSRTVCVAFSCLSGG